MTQSEQELNIAMCEWRGWTEWKPEPSTPFHNRMWIKDGEVNPFLRLPNHIDDITSLGHVHETEKGLSDEQWTDYANLLYYITYVPNAKDRDRRMLQSTAKQRTIAILSIVNPTFIEAWKKKYPNEH